MSTTTKIGKSEAAEATPFKVELGEMQQITVKITGTTPLIQHSTRGMDLGNPEDGEKISQSKKKVRSVKEQAELGTYPTGNGTFYHPAEAFRSALIDAVCGMKVGKKASAAALFTTTFFTVSEQAILVDQKNGKPLTKYEIDERIGRNPSTGGAVQVIRPIWREWACVVTFEYDPTNITEAMIVSALNLAGQRVGIGSLRPTPPKKNPKRGKGGRYGKFKAEIV